MKSIEYVLLNSSGDTEMEITHGSQLQFEASGLTHRNAGKGIEFKYLSLGEEGTPENYLLTLTRQTDFYSPVHHHNFDQFRYAMKGDVSLGRNGVLKEGQISYHPEGAYYGPQQDDPDHERIVLVLQCGGASGQGYMSFAQLRQANKQLSMMGKFEGGKFYGENGSIKDGYQALWEHVSGRKLEYPRARYTGPVIIDPASFTWRPVNQQVNSTPSQTNGHSGQSMWRKPLGTFSERELRVEQLLVQPGSTLQIGSPEAFHLLVALEGTGRVGSDELVKESTIRLNPGATAEVSSSTEDLLLIHFVMPQLV